MFKFFNKMTMRPETQFTYYIQRKQYDFAIELLEKGEVLINKSFYGPNHTPLYYAVYYGALDIVRWILQKANNSHITLNDKDIFSKAILNACSENATDKDWDIAALIYDPHSNSDKFDYDLYIAKDPNKVEALNQALNHKKILLDEPVKLKEETSHSFSLPWWDHKKGTGKEAYKPLLTDQKKYK